MTETTDEIAKALVAVTEEILGITGVRPEDDFLRLGGNSIMAFRLAVRIEAVFGVYCPQAAIFDSRSLSELTQFIVQSQSESAGGEANLLNGESGKEAT
ncbi:MAG: acyl carrier protein [Pseudomonadota bacterium]